MSRLTVHAQQIRKLTLTKQHTASIAWELDLYAMQHLSASSYRVWHFIRALAAFDTQCYSTKLSQEFLAEKLCCSVKTISRAIGEIKNAGLIEVQNNISIKTGTGANTYFITFPKEAYKQAEAKSDKIATNAPPSMTIDLEATQKQTIRKEAGKPLEKKEEIKVADLAATNLAKSRDKVDLTPPVKTDVHYSEFIFREKNNKAVVVNFFDDEKESTLQTKVNQLSTLLTQLNQQKQTLKVQLNKNNPITSTDDRLSVLKKALTNPQSINTSGKSEEVNIKLKQLDQLQLKIEQINRQHEQTTVELKRQKRSTALYKDPSCINQLEGQRQLSDEEIQLLLAKLNPMSLSTEKRNQLANEIIYEARFGSLVKNNQTQQDNPIKRAINIGCKLIRAGQWCTPAKINVMYQ